MALDYADLFGNIGACIKHIDLLGADALALDADRDEIETSFQGTGQEQHIQSLLSGFNGLKQSHAGLRSQLAEIVTRRLRDRTTVVNELQLPSDSTGQVLPALVTAMNNDAASVNASVVGIGAVSADAGNIGDGTVIASKVLDGATPPGRGMAAHLEYDGLDSELSIAETMTLACVSDSQTDGATAGSERFQWSGEIPNSDKWGVKSEGSGSGPSLMVLNGNTTIKNRSFEDFTSDAPDHWTIAAGTAGTHIFEETTAADVYRGDGSLRFTGDGAQAGISITQAVTTTQVKPRKRYLCSLRYKADATIAAGTFTVQFEGTDYTAASSEKIEIAAGSLATTWTHEFFWINMPDTIPSDFKLVLKWIGTPTASKSLWIDSLAFGAPAWHNGIALAVIAGAESFVRGDRFTLAVTNTEGVMQQFFRKSYGIQLPSDNAGAETIADSLAT